MIKLLASPRELIGRYRDYMLPGIIAIGSTFVMVGFIFWSEPQYSNYSLLKQWGIIAVIIFGFVSMIVSLFILRSEEKENKIHNQSLLLYLIAFTRKQGVDVNDMQEARKMLDIIYSVNANKKNLSISDIEIILNKKDKNKTEHPEHFDSEL